MLQYLKKKFNPYIQLYFSKGYMIYDMFILLQHHSSTLPKLTHSPTEFSFHFISLKPQSHSSFIAFSPQINPSPLRKKFLFVYLIFL